ncbi:MAG: ABC transporter permease, partial [bacterium]|nr:ABC transporter permease [bacterium]
KEEIEEYGDSKYVSNYYYTFSISLNSSTLERASEEMNSNNGLDMNIIGKGGGIRNERMDSGDFTVIGYSSYESMSDFISGNYTIKEGEVREDFTSDTCIINSELASLNDISVGDKIILVDPDNEEITYQLEVSGIYDDNSEESSSDMQAIYSKSVNTIITNTIVMNHILEKDENLRVNVNPRFILISKDVVDSFREEVTKKGLSEYYQITTNVDTITSETESVSNISNFAITFLFLTLIIGGIVLFVLNMINVRERKYEIGVLRMIGMKKSLVISQFVLELLIVAIVALLLGACLGSILSVPTANSLLESEINSANEQVKNIEENFGRLDMSNNSGGRGFDKMSGVVKVEQVSSIHATVDMTVLLQLLGISLILTLVSSIASMISISRFSPITILKERS